MLNSVLLQSFFTLILNHTWKSYCRDENLMTAQILILDIVNPGLSALGNHDNGVNVYAYRRSLIPLQLLLVTATEGGGNFIYNSIS
jgi:hypothetical protein